MFEEIFREDTKQILDYFYVGFSGEDFVGIISICIHNIDSCYIQCAGFDDNIKKYHRPLLFKEAVKFIHKEFKNIAFKVENINTAAIKVAMNCGFIPMTTEIDMAYKDNMFMGKIYLIMREVK